MNTSPAARTLAIILALSSLTVGFGAIDLLSPWILHEGSQVSEVGYGTLAGLIIPVGLLAQAWKPELHLAGLQQVALAALAYLAAGAITGERPLILAGAITAVAAVGVGALRPGRHALLPLSPRPSLLLLALALAAAAPGSQYALHMAFNQRNDVPPADAHLGLGHWAALSAAAIAALLAALLASLRTPGFTIPGLTSAAAVLTWAITCLLYPDSAGALNHTWAGLAIAWALVFGAVTIHARRKPRTPGCSWGRVALPRPLAPSPGREIRPTKVTIGHVMLRLRWWCLGLGILALALWAVSWSWLVGVGMTVVRIGEVGALLAAVAAVALGVTAPKRSQNVGLWCGAAALVLVIGLNLLGLLTG